MASLPCSVVQPCERDCSLLVMQETAITFLAFIAISVVC